MPLRGWLAISLVATTMLTGCASDASPEPSPGFVRSEESKTTPLPQEVMAPAAVGEWAENEYGRARIVNVTHINRSGIDYARLEWEFEYKTTEPLQVGIHYSAASFISSRFEDKATNHTAELPLRGGEQTATLETRTADILPDGSLGGWRPSGNRTTFTYAEPLVTA